MCFFCFILYSRRQDSHGWKPIYFILQSLKVEKKDAHTDEDDQTKKYCENNNNKYYKTKYFFSKNKGEKAKKKKLVTR